MVTPHPPTIGDWYRNIHSGERFEVVALDEDAGTIEIQTYDGDVDEMDLATWHASNLEAIDPPEDPMGSVDMDAEELGYNDSEPTTGGDETSYEEALESLEGENVIGLDEEE